MVKRLVLCAALVFAPALSPAIEVRELALNSQTERVSAAAIDPENKVALFALATSDFKYTMEGIPTTIVEVRLDNFSLTKSIHLNQGENPVSTIAFSGSGHDAYFGIFGDPNRDVSSSLIRFDLARSTETARLSLGSGAYGIASMVVDSLRGAAYAGTQYGTLVGIQLSSMTVTGSLRLQKEDHSFTCAAIDPAARFAYFATASGNLMKIDLDRFTPAANLSISKRENGFRSAAIDPTGKFLYLGTQNAPSRVIEVNLESFQRSDSLDLPAGAGDLVVAGFDAATQSVLFGTDGAPSRLFKIGVHPLRIRGQISLPAKEGKISCGVFDSSRHVFYVGLQQPTKAVLMRLPEPQDARPPGPTTP